MLSRSTGQPRAGRIRRAAIGLAAFSLLAAHSAFALAADACTDLSTVYGSCTMSQGLATVVLKTESTSISGYYGGSGYSEYPSGSYQFAGPKTLDVAGYQIDSLTMRLDGTGSTYGAATLYFTLELPGPAGVVGGGTLPGGGTDRPFSIEGSYKPSDLLFLSSPMLVLHGSVPYVQGPNGTALTYSTASFSLRNVTWTARVSPTPEASTMALTGLGLLAALAGLRRRTHATS